MARIGGKMSLERFEGAQLFWKGDDSMVTNADLEIQSWLVGEITEAFPDDGVLGEEGLAPRPSRTDAPYVWVLCPPRGTRGARCCVWVWQLPHRRHEHLGAREPRLLGVDRGASRRASRRGGGV